METLLGPKEGVPTGSAVPRSFQRTAQPSPAPHIGLPIQFVGLLNRLAEFAAVYLTGEATMRLDALTAPGGVAHSDGVALLVAALYTIVAEATGAHDAEVQFSIRRAWSRVLNAWLVAILFAMALGFLIRMNDDAALSWVPVWLVLGGTALTLTRGMIIMWTRRMKRRGSFNQRAAIFGAGQEGERIARYVLEHDKLTLTLTGFYDERGPHRTAPGLPLSLRGNSDDLVEAIRAGEVDQVIIAMPWSAEGPLRRLVEKLAMTPVRIRLAPDRVSFLFTQRPVVLLGELPVMTLFERPISGLDQGVKWLEDKIITVLLLAAAAPLMLLIALAIRLDSPGPIFFRQLREGFNNRPFQVWKFRSMRVGGAADVVQASRRDPRVTRVGAFIRRTSLDELPQLINVLLGHMSLVGPRPHAPSTRAGGRLFGEVVASYAARHKVKPGLTGWAQACGWRGETDTEEKLVKRLEHDLYYIENWSLWFDLYIMLRTAATVLLHRTAY